MAQDNYLPLGFYNEDCLPRMREYPDKHTCLVNVAMEAVYKAVGK